MMPYIWFEPALLGTTKAELCAQTCVILLYFLLQNSGYWLHGTVFCAGLALEVDVDVPFVVSAPRCVTDFFFVVCVDWFPELEALLELRRVLWPG